MDGLQLVRKQAMQDTNILNNTTEITKARQSATVNYPSIKDRLDAMDTATTTVQNNLDQAISGLHWKPSVATKGDLTTTYPNPQEGWTVSVNDTNLVYRYDDDTQEWMAISSNSIGKATITADGLMSKEDKSKLDGLNDANYVKKTGDTMTGRLTVNGGIAGELTGNSSSSTKLQTPRAIALSGDVTGTVNFDGSTNVSIATTVVNKGITSVRLNRLRNRVQVNVASASINIGIPNYVVANDILNVYLAGVRLEPTVDYNSTQTTVTLTNAQQFVNGDIVTFEVIQAVAT